MCTYPIDIDFDIDDDESSYDADLEIGMDVIDFEDPADSYSLPSFDD